MRKLSVSGILCAFFMMCVVVGRPSQVRAQTLVDTSSETRFQLDFHVPDAVLASMMPAGFTSSVATQGPAKDCNIRVIFIDLITVHGPDGKIIGNGSNRMVYLVAPAKDAEGKNVQVVVAGLTQDSADAPGPFGVYQFASKSATTRTISSTTGSLTETQDWSFTAATGEHIEMHVKFDKGVGNKGKPNVVKFYSAKNPAYYEITGQEQILDILRNTTTNPTDRVKEFTFKASGGVYSKLFPGTEKTLSWDNMLWLNRTVSLP